MQIGLFLYYLVESTNLLHVILSENNANDVQIIGEVSFISTFFFQPF